VTKNERVLIQKKPIWTQMTLQISS